MVAIAPKVSALNSSEEKQREFFTHFFRAWDRYRNYIPMASWYIHTDLPDSAVKEYLDYLGISRNPVWTGLVQTAGLRTYPNGDTDKLAFKRLKTELTIRHWR